MKIRNGFVSNSSSSSFIVAIDTTKNKPCKCCGRKDLDLVDAIDSSVNYCGDENDIEAYDYKETIKKINEAGWYDVNAKDALLEKLKAYNNKKWRVISIKLSYHNSTLRDIMDNMVASKAAVILFEDN